MQTRSLEFDRSNFANDILVLIILLVYESKLKKKSEDVRECVRVNRLGNYLNVSVQQDKCVTVGNIFSTICVSDH